MDKHKIIWLKKQSHSNRSLEKMLWNDDLKDLTELENGGDLWALSHIRRECFKFCVFSKIEIE
nr:hypothetical protein [uncultured Acetobacterium sp.]